MSANCDKHGYFPHIAAHEAGHAVTAIILGFAFKDVTLQPERVTTAILDTGQDARAGGVDMGVSSKEWVGSRVEDALVFVMAGQLAEKALLGDNLEHSAVGDFVEWRKGSGVEGNESADLQSLRLAATARAKEIVFENQATIKRVYGLFLDQLPNRHQQDFDLPLTLTYDEIRTAVLGDGS